MSYSTKPNELIDRNTWNNKVCPPVVRAGRFVGDAAVVVEVERGEAAKEWEASG